MSNYWIFLFIGVACVLGGAIIGYLIRDLQKP